MKIPTLSESSGKIVLFRRYEDETYLKEKSGIKLEWQDRKGSEVKDLLFEKSDVANKVIDSNF